MQVNDGGLKTQAVNFKLLANSGRMEKQPLSVLVQFHLVLSVFVKNISGFSVLVPDVVFGFSYFVLFGFRFLFDLSST